MLVKGDKLVQKKEMNGFNFKGKEFYITKVSEDGVITFRNDSMGMGIMTYKEFEEYFEKVKTWSQWEEIRHNKSNNDIRRRTDGKRVEVYINDYHAQSSCLKEDIFDLEKGTDICIKRIEIQKLESQLKEIKTQLKELVK